MIGKRLRAGGSAGNEHLTAVVGAVLILLLAIEGATLLNVQSLLTVHAFVGMLLIPVLVLKLASTGWRMLRYYLRKDEYVRRGPPQVVLRVLVSPVLVLSTFVVFGTGVALLVLNQRHGTLVGLHKASFLVWAGAFGIHLLAHALRLPATIFRRVPGALMRIAVVGAAIAAGGVLALATLPGADRLQDGASAHIGVDDR